MLIVTLIGYSVAGDRRGALAATVAMCGPTALLAYYVSRFLERSRHARWPAIIQAALVPLSIGLMAASGLIVAQTSDQSWIAGLITIGRGRACLCDAAQPFLDVACRRSFWVLLALSDENR